MKRENFIFDFNDIDSPFLTHSLHPYPAKFPPQLPRKILSLYGKQGDTVLDPFCGSGTTLVEGRLQGLNVIGVDVNGLACLLSKVKATPLNLSQIEIIRHVTQQIQNLNFRFKFGDKFEIQVKEIEGLSHWFQDNVAKELTIILTEIEKLSDNDVKDFLKIIFSSIIVRVSNQESDTRFAAIKKNIPDCLTFDLFIERTKEYSNRICDFSKQIVFQTEFKIYNADSRNLNFIEPESVDLIITSPPYANTYDYYLYHKFRKRWLDLNVQFAQYNEIVSRREYSSLKKNPEKWIKDLKICFAEMNRVLKKNKLAFVVIGDSVIKKELMKIDEIIKGFSASVGFKICDIITSDLASHSKIFNPNFAQKGKKEHLIILQKYV